MVGDGMSEVKERQLRQRTYLSLNKFIMDECPNYRACLAEFGKCKQIMNLQELPPFKLACKVLRDALLHYETLGPAFAHVAQLRQQLAICQEPQGKKKKADKKPQASLPQAGNSIQNRPCKQCGQTFTPSSNAQKYCHGCRPPRMK